MDIHKPLSLDDGMLLGTSDFMVWFMEGASEFTAPWYLMVRYSVSIRDQYQNKSCLSKIE